MSRNSYSQNTFLEVFDGAPVRLWWGGWCSTTHDLKRAGWTIHASSDMREDMAMLQVRLAARCPDNRMIITGTRLLHYAAFESMDVQRTIHEGWRMQHYHTERDLVTTMAAPDWTSMTKLAEIDPYGAVCHNVGEMRRNFKDLKIFQEVAADAAQRAIYIRPESVDECLNRILELQWPEQKELRGKLIMPEAKPIVTAQILTLAA